MVDRTGKFYRIEDLDPEFVSGRVDPSYKEYAGRYVKNDYDASLEGSDTTLDIDICVMLKRKGTGFQDREARAQLSALLAHGQAGAILSSRFRGSYVRLR
jgi:hypothetical protein